ncbi:hypothetical protein [Ktedonospora formicarum]|uniref:Uncharacterized protein n=1 Tax=Ktedonospora formicarum TaxID=2778364 RepID=A0A8J3IE20_9CHLR|nr:hypothetical protein [Ktedonospora formicarum]GHO49599.1 hypothetical protein KSX_77620 [Ktedonospora formicarum]
MQYFEGALGVLAALIVIGGAGYVTREKIVDRYGKQLTAFAVKHLGIERFLGAIPRYVMGEDLVNMSLTNGHISATHVANAALDALSPEMQRNVFFRRFASSDVAVEALRDLSTSDGARVALDVFGIETLVEVSAADAVVANTAATEALMRAQERAGVAARTAGRREGALQALTASDNQ